MGMLKHTLLKKLPHLIEHHVRPFSHYGEIFASVLAFGFERQLFHHPPAHIMVLCQFLTQICFWPVATSTIYSVTE